MPEDFTRALRNVGSGSSDSSDLDRSDSDGDISEPEELREWRRIMREPPPDASAPQLRNALGIAQLAYSKLHAETKKLRNDYNSLLSTLPQNRKRAVENNPNTVLDNNIVAQAKKYCFFYRFWIPKDLFPLTTPPPGYDLDDPARWSTPESKLAGFKAELYLMLPNDLKVRATTYSNFGRVFSNAVGAERPNILKPVKDNAQQLFAYLGLGADLFAAENSRTLRGSNEAVKALLRMHPGNVDARYTPLSPILFPKPDAPVARDLFKTQLLVNIIRVMVFGKSVLAGKRRGGPQGRGQKLGISGASAGLIAIAATFSRYLLSTDRELTTIGEESGFKYQDDFEYFIELLSDLSKREWSMEVMEFINQGVWNISSHSSANARPGSSTTSVAPSWESDILAQLNGPRQPTPPPRTPSPDLRLIPASAGTVSIPHYMPEATNGRAADSFVISQSANSATSALSIDVANLSLRGTHISALPSQAACGGELSAPGRRSGSEIADVPVPLPSASAREPPEQGRRATRSRKGKGRATPHKENVRGLPVTLRSTLVQLSNRQILDAATKKQKYDRIMAKVTYPIDLPCHSVLTRFGAIFNYTRALADAKQVRYDDLESLAYVLMHFFRSTLPRQGLNAATKKLK
ncbi:hypothetical protein BKA83DRAFT_4490450 [Pisolithus microcarpus]|nr:hypothetical protein BKA83DRAFT_4490450 [Pisolithus microcarpus]